MKISSLIFSNLEPTITVRLSMLLPGVVAPSRECPDGDKYRQANTEVYNHSEIISSNMPGGRRQVRHDQEIHDIARQHGDQRLSEIHPSWF